jgi:signal transduction histidine kinase/CheY-like chemotaxis protein
MDYKTEVKELRRGLLGTFVIAVAALGWLWFGYFLGRPEQLSIDIIPTLLLWCAAYVSYKLLDDHLALSSWVLLLGFVLAVGSIETIHPAWNATPFGVLGVIAGSALLGLGGGLVVAMMTWTAGSVILPFGPNMWRADSADMLVLYLLVLGASSLTNRPLRVVVQSALTGWENARSALSEVRQRRAGIYRALRSLEEATYRIERLNNELIVAQREAEKARTTKARLLATVSHEIRGPLNLILGFSKLMALSPESYGEALPRTYRADVQTVFRSAQHLVDLVDDVLDLSQVEAERLPLIKKRLDLNEDVINKVVAEVEPLAQRKRLYLRWEAEKDLPSLVGDEVRLRQALLNLVVNAVRFTERGGITIHASRRDDHLLVSVQDTGPGIPPEAIPTLFREFSRVKMTDTSKVEGSGLGLVITKHLIELHGGRIWVESQSGKGTTFRFTIPLSGEQSAAATTIEVGQVRREAEPHTTCLIVHDDPRVTKLLARHVEGYRAIGLVDEKEVVGTTDRLRPRAIVTTPERAERIRTQLWRSSLHVPIISCGMPRLVEDPRFEGIAAYLTKPVAPESLAAVVSQLEHGDETTVLLVDDDPDAVRLMQRALMAVPHPCNILKAYDGVEALKLMKEMSPDIVLLDLVLPEIDGITVLARMREDKDLCRIPVVIVSGRDWMEDVVTLSTKMSIHLPDAVGIATFAGCLQALLDAFMNQPFALDRLLENNLRPQCQRQLRLGQNGANHNGDSS